MIVDEGDLGQDEVDENGQSVWRGEGDAVFNEELIQGPRRRCVHYARQNGICSHTPESYTGTRRPRMR